VTGGHLGSRLKAEIAMEPVSKLMPYLERRLAASLAAADTALESCGRIAQQDLVRRYRALILKRDQEASVSEPTIGQRTPSVELKHVSSFS